MNWSRLFFIVSAMLSISSCYSMQKNVSAVISHLLQAGENNQTLESKEDQKNKAITKTGHIQKYLNFRKTLLGLADAFTDEEIDSNKVLKAFNKGLNLHTAPELINCDPKTLEKLIDIPLAKSLIDDSLDGREISHAKVRKAIKTDELIKLFNCTPDTLKNYIDVDELVRLTVEFLKKKPVTKEQLQRTVNKENIKTAITQPAALQEYFELKNSLSALLDLLYSPNGTLEQGLKIVNHAFHYPQLMSLICNLDSTVLATYVDFNHFTGLIDLIADNKEVPQEQLTKLIKFDTIANKLGLDPATMQKYVKVEKCAKLIFDCLSHKKVNKQYIYQVFDVALIELDLGLVSGLLNTMIDDIYADPQAQVPHTQRFQLSQSLKSRLEGFATAAATSSLALATAWTARALVCLMPAALGYSHDSCTDFFSPGNWPKLTQLGALGASYMLYKMRHVLLSPKRQVTIATNAAAQQIVNSLEKSFSVPKKIEGGDFSSLTFIDFKRSLTEEQKAHITQDILDEAQLEPHVLLEHKNFIYSLDNRQMLLLAALIKVFKQ